jgi:hypothetical protein
MIQQHTTRNSRIMHSKSISCCCQEATFLYIKVKSTRCRVSSLICLLSADHGQILVGPSKCFLRKAVGETHAAEFFFTNNKNPNSHQQGLEPGWLGCTSTTLAKWGSFLEPSICSARMTKGLVCSRNQDDCSIVQLWEWSARGKCSHFCMGVGNS